MEKQPTGSKTEHLSPAARGLLLLTRFYQVVISPWTAQSCRHLPTCSDYMIQAIREWGALRGGWLGLKRLSRCHPWGTSGYDPVPERASESEKPNSVNTTAQNPTDHE
ncbi:MAG: membrane protein insertion efficiency factor YidD [Balneolaceae bacterium]